MNNLDVTPPQIRAVAFDLDGTIYLGNTVVDGAVELVRDLRSAGRDVFFFTNSSTRSRVQVLEKLAKMGLEPRLDHIYTSAYAAAVYLATQAVSSVFCLGTAGLKEELAGNGIEVTSDPFKAEALLVGLDPDFSYGKLAEVMAFAATARPIVACNRDRSYPIENGRLLPGCGPGVAAVEAILGRTVDFVAGKPTTYMMQLLEADWGVTNSEIVVIGDSLESDISMAKEYGCKSFLISRGSPGRFEGMTIVPDISSIKHYFL